MKTPKQLVLINKEKSKTHKAVALCAAIFCAWSFVSAPIYADGNRAEFNKEISGERKSDNYDKLSGKNSAGGGDKQNITSGEGSASGSVAKGSVSGSTAGGALSGTASGSVLSGSAEGSYSADKTENGIKASASGRVKGTLAEGTASGQANTSLGPINAGAQGQATGSVGGEAHAGGQASVSTSGVTLEGGAGASAAAKISGEGSCTVSCFGVSLTGTAEGDLRAGASAEAHGIISLNGGKIIFGGKIAGALGVGGGVGGSIKIDASKLIDNVKDWFKSKVEPKPEPTPSPQTPTPAQDNNVTTNFGNFDALHQGGLGSLNATPTAALDGVSSRDLATNLGDHGQPSKSEECEGHK